MSTRLRFYVVELSEGGGRTLLGAAFQSSWKEVLLVIPWLSLSSVCCWLGPAREQNLVIAFRSGLPARTFGWVQGFHGTAGPPPCISSGFGDPTALPKWPPAWDILRVRSSVYHTENSDFLGAQPLQ